MSRPVLQRLELRLGVINIPISVGPAAWGRCLRETADRADIFGVNESFTLAQRRLFRRVAKALGLLFYLLFRGPNPIFYDPDLWVRVSGRQAKLHGRGPWWRRWPGFNWSRYASIGVFRSTTPGLPWLTVINTHWVPRGRKVPTWWRNRARRRSIEKAEALVARHRALGRIVIVMGDLNMGEAPDIRHVQWIRDDAGVDELGIALPDDWRISTVAAARFAAPTDHGHGKSAALQLVQLGEAA